MDIPDGGLRHADPNDQDVTHGDVIQHRITRTGCVGSHGVPRDGHLWFHRRRLKLTRDATEHKKQLSCSRDEVARFTWRAFIKQYRPDPGDDLSRAGKR